MVVVGQESEKKLFNTYQQLFLKKRVIDINHIW